MSNVTVQQSSGCNEADTLGGMSPSAAYVMARMMVPSHDRKQPNEA
jgi:hypothetical protein